MVRIATNTNLNGAYRPILCSGRNKFTIDWNKQGHEWAKVWMDMVKGEQRYLRSLIMLPLEVNGVLIWVNLWRKRQDLVVGAWYHSKFDFTSIFIHANLKLVMLKTSGKEITLSRRSVTGHITRSETFLFTIEPIYWKTCSFRRPPILIIEIINLEKQY
jgi:hypothetical protein